MKILAIETSCDETAAAIVVKKSKENCITVLSSVIASSLKLHSETGGVIPDIAAREQLRHILPVVKKSFNDSGLTEKDIDAIAVTQGPGLIGSLLIGIETAKTLSYLWNKSIIPVNHLLGHIYANFIGETKNSKFKIKNYTVNIKFPLVTLLVSGGHTDLILMKNHNNVKWLGGTLDDAAGEAFDKIGRLLDLPYPAGPAIEKLAERGDVSRFTFPRPMIGSKDFNFSFSGLKAAVAREVCKLKKGVAPEEGLPTARTLGALAGGKLATEPQLDDKTKIDIASSVQKSIIEVLVRKTLRAAKKYNAKSILLAGGVAANQKLRDEFKLKIKNLKLKIPLFYPKRQFCTDNAVMIGAYAAFHPQATSWNKITANPELYF